MTNRVVLIEYGGVRRVGCLPWSARGKVEYGLATGSTHATMIVQVSSFGRAESCGCFPFGLGGPRPLIFFTGHGRYTMINNKSMSRGLQEGRMFLPDSAARGLMCLFLVCLPTGQAWARPYGVRTWSQYHNFSSDYNNLYTDLWDGTTQLTYNQLVTVHFRAAIPQSAIG